MLVVHQSAVKEVAISKQAVMAFCHKYHIRKLSLFGSILRSDFRPSSDVDVLVEFQRGHTPHLITLGQMQDELSDLWGRPVDLKTAGFLSRHFRQQVVDTAQTIYECQG